MAADVLHDNTKSQGISSHGIDTVLPEYSWPSNSQVNP